MVSLDTEKFDSGTGSLIKLRCTVDQTVPDSLLLLQQLRLSPWRHLLLGTLMATRASTCQHVLAHGNLKIATSTLNSSSTA